MKRFLLFILLSIPISFLAQTVVFYSQDLKTVNNIETDFPIKEIIIGPGGQIIIVGDNAETVEHPGAKDYSFTDSEGNSWSVDKDGAISGPNKPAEGGKSTAENTDGVDANGNSTEITSKGISVTFEDTRESQYAFDAANSSNKKYPDYVLKDNYTLLGKDYYVPYKAVNNQQTDILLAKIKLTDSQISVDSLIFKTKEGAKIEAEKISPTEFKLTVKGAFSYATQEVQAVIKQEGRYKIAGVFKLVHISDKEPAKIIIATLGSTAPNEKEVESYLNSIYNKAGAHFSVGKTIELDSNLISQSTLNTEKSGFAAQYTTEQQKIHSAIKSRSDFDPQAYYLILTDKKASSGENGFMPLGRQFGYVFNGNTHTMAHELGHGVFSLRHPYSQKGEYPEGKTDWLMDYSTPNTKLPYRDWNSIQDPKLRIGWFDDKSEGEINYNVHDLLTPQGKFIDSFKNEKGEQIKKIIYLIGDTYWVNSVKYEDNEYTWNSGVYTFGNLKLIPQIDTDKSNSVNIVKQSDGCEYWYQVISWDTKYKFIDQESLKKDIEGKITTNWIKKGFTIVSAEVNCTENFIEKVLKRDTLCDESDYADEADVNLKKLTNKDKPDHTVNVINSSCISSLRNLDYERWKMLFVKIASQNDIEEYSGLAILRMMSALKKDRYKDFIVLLTQDKEKLYKNLVLKVKNKYNWFFESNVNEGKNGKNLIEALTYIVNEINEENIQWQFINLSLSTAFEDTFFNNLTDSKKQSIVKVLMAMGNSELGSTFFVEMINNFFGELKDFRDIHTIAKLREENRELFTGFTFVSDNSHTWILPSSTNSEVLSLPWRIYIDEHFKNFKLYMEEDRKVNIQEVLAAFIKQFSLYVEENTKNSHEFWKQEVDCKNIKSFLAQISKKENKESLSKIDGEKRREVIRVFFDKNCSGNNKYVSTYSFDEEPIIKLINSFESKDQDILVFLENIGFDRIFAALSGSVLNKFLFWTASQIESSGHFTENKDYFVKGGDLITDPEKILQLEQDLLQFKNTGFKVNDKTSFKVGSFGTINYNEKVPIHIAGRFEFLGEKYKKASVLYAPLIQFIAMSNDNTNKIYEKSAWIVLDGLSLALGVGEAKILFTVGNTLRKTIVVMDIVGTTAGATAQALNNDAISDDFRFNLQMASIAMSIPQIATSLTKVDKIVTKLDDQLNAQKGIDNSQKSVIGEYIQKLFKTTKNPLLAKFNAELLAKFNTLDKTSQTKFLDDFSGISDEGIKILNSKPHLVEYWAKNADFYKGKYHGLEHTNWETSAETMRKMGSREKDLVDAIDPKLNPLIHNQKNINKLLKENDGTFDAHIVASGSSGDGKLVVSYNRRQYKNKKLENDDLAYKNFVENELHPFLQQQLEYLDFIRKDLTLGHGKLYEKLYGGVIDGGKLLNAQRPGIHAEVLTLNELIKGKTINSIEDIKALDIEIIVKHKTLGHMCTCPNCFFITQGVKMINSK